MQTKKANALKSLLSLLLITGVIIFAAVSRADSISEEIIDPYYIGLGAGSSFLRPGSDDATLSLSQNNDFAYRIFTGYQLDENWAAEIFYSDLGKSEVKSKATSNTVGFINYQAFGAGALYIHQVSETWQVFGTVGAGLLQNDIQFVSAESSEDSFIYAGAGIAWKVANTWELRAEYDFYKTEAQLLTINIVKHFGFGKSKRVRSLEKELQQKDQALHDANTKLSSAPYAATKKQQNCDGFKVDFEGVVFFTGLIELNAKARLKLDELAKKLLTLPEDITFEIRAHTDDTGTEEYNYRLSLARGREVRDYLSKHGIALARMDVHGYGEWGQKQGEDEKSSRAASRRAELQLVGIEKYVEDTSSCYP